jgi:tetratricopeptide (TPR) repeat protein
MLFGKKKLSVSPWKSAIEADTELLRAFGNTLDNEISFGLAPRIEKLYRYVAEQVSREINKLQNYLPILIFVSSKYPRGWLLLASLYEELTELDNRFDLAKDSVRHFLESAKLNEEKREAWRRLADYCRRTQDWLGEVHANVELGQLPESSFQDVSDNANRLNSLLREQLSLDSDEKRILVNKYLEIMEKRIDDEGSGTDYSRMAWLAWNIRAIEKAIEYTEKGLALEPDNIYIQSLAQKLGIY